MHPTPFALPYRGWEDAARVAREHFGVTAFRPGQRELALAVLAGQDAVPRARRGGGRARSRILGASEADGAAVRVTVELTRMTFVER